MPKENPIVYLINFILRYIRHILLELLELYHDVIDICHLHVKKTHVTGFKCQ